MSREYVDFYGYTSGSAGSAGSAGSSGYKKLTADFMDCIRSQQPVLDSKEPVYNTSAKRIEQVIWVNGTTFQPTFQVGVENCMRTKGYTRYVDYNFYENVSKV